MEMIILRVCLAVVLSSMFAIRAYSQHLLGPAPEGSVATPDGKDSVEKVSTTRIVLLATANNSVQLGVPVNGQFTYPFTFVANPAFTNGISISESGVVSGTPSKTDDQNTEITVRDNNGKLLAKYPIVLHFAGSVPVMLGSESAADDVQPAPKNPPKDSAKDAVSADPIYAGGDTLTGTVRPDATGGNKSGGGEIVRIKCDPNTNPKPKPQSDPKQYERKDRDAGAETGCAVHTVATTPTDSNNAFSYQFNRPLYEGDTVWVRTSSSAVQKVSVQRPPLLLGEEMRAIVGYQQTGASSSPFTQDWFLDFYISRPLAFLRRTEGTDIKWRWWGNVRVASFPQPGNQTVAEVASGLAAQVGALKLNQLAQGAEFLSGVEFQPIKSFPFRGFSENTRQVFSLGFIAGVGATGFFSAPTNNLQIFAVPTAGPQLATFQKAYPQVSTANIAFIAPELERFPKEYLAGFRLSTHYRDPTGKPLTSSPAMLAFTVGQNQVITGSKFRGVLGRIEAFYPLPFGNRGETKAGAFSSIYLFGTAQLRFGGNTIAPPLVLAPVTGVSASDPSVTLIPSANTRDLYRIGFGVDMVGLISSLTGGTSKKATAGTNTAVSNTPASEPQPVPADGGVPHP
jgi:hypothetical protein